MSMLKPDYIDIDNDGNTTEPMREQYVIGGIVKAITKFAKKCNYKTLRFKDIWTVVYDENDYQTPHTHGPIGWSGILYYEYDAKQPSTVFIQPWHNIKTGLTSMRSLDTQEGDMIFFPSFVMHFCPANHLKKKRKIEYGSKFILNTNDKTAYSESFDTVSMLFTPDTNINNQFVVNQNVFSAYGIYGQQLNKLGYQFGLRLEQALISPRLLTTNETYENNYFSFFRRKFFVYWIS